jgi:hypothetical protein
MGTLRVVDDLLKPARKPAGKVGSLGNVYTQSQFLLVT